ncbi:MAG: Nif3-like dinuclear metal center hexameric protein [Oscillospiraceae bacterium]|nr:Nif3-like dinuclear metal center hexameric protein [Oscillospiraceae bacterium]
MTRVKDVLEFLFTMAPEVMKEPWDHVGLGCGHLNQEVHRILVALDPFADVLEEAIARGADLIVTHHPLLFHATNAITDGDAHGSVVLRAAETGRAIISMHTNLDSAPCGVNDCLAAALGLQNVTVLSKAGEDAQGRAYGLGRIGELESTPLPAFAAQVSRALGCKGLRYASGGVPVHQVAVGGGACGEFLRLAKQSGCDTFVTSDLRYNDFWDSADLGMNILDAGHFATENPVCDYLLARLRARFPEIPAEKSACHDDVIEYFVHPGDNNA